MYKRHKGLKLVQAADILSVENKQQADRQRVAATDARGDLV
jgi:hypothetical protein